MVIKSNNNSITEAAFDYLKHSIPHYTSDKDNHTARYFK
jgi:hypothetical protein